jgi:sugar/nucleoside kinase (ribokinase family)
LQRGLLHDGLPDLLRRLQLAEMTISLDTNDDPNNVWSAPLPEILPFIDILLPNESEFCRMAGISDLNGAIRFFAEKVATIVVKRGIQGVRVHQAGKKLDVAPIDVVPVDTIGAGNSFNAGFLRAFLLEKVLAICARAGNITGHSPPRRKAAPERFSTNRFATTSSRSTTFLNYFQLRSATLRP